jgi:hypothetical protein
MITGGDCISGLAVLMLFVCILRAIRGAIIAPESSRIDSGEIGGIPQTQVLDAHPQGANRIRIGGTRIRAGPRMHSSLCNLFVGGWIVEYKNPHLGVDNVTVI